MRVVTLTWSREALGTTSFSQLDETVQKLSIMGHLNITKDGVRQIAMPIYRDGKSSEDMEAIEFITVEQHLNERESDALVIWNEHPLVLLASGTENIHILPPYEYENGSITVTVRGLPDAISTFVNLCKAFLPPDKISVQNIQQQDELFKELLTNRQYECITLASQHGYYEHERKVTIQGLAEAMNIACSTFQEHLQAAEEAILRWSSEQLR